MNPKLPLVVRFAAVAALVLLPFAAAPAAEPPAAPRNVVLVSIDTLRADRLGCYGRAGDPTPNLDRLAARGVRFDRAFAAAPVTTPSHATMLTGQWPPVLGVRTNGADRIPTSTPTLAERLAARGYATAGFVGAFPLDRQFGFSRGFSTYDDEMPGTSSRFDAERRGEVVIDRALAWLSSRDRSKPFFLFVHLYDPHRTYDPPEPFASRWAKDPYQGEVAYADAQVGRLLGALSAEGRDADTVLAVVSDHGEGLGEHGEETHMTFVYDSTLRVPFLLAGPGMPAGKVAREPARIVDLVPTLLAAAGQEPAAGIAGVDLAPAWSGGKLPADRLFWAESLVPQLQFDWAPLASVRQGRYKYIRAPREEVYDIEGDPGETKNLLGTDADRDGDLRRLLRRAEKGLVPVAPPPAEAPPLDPEAVARLASLGYLASSGSANSAADPMKLPDPKDRIALVNAYESMRLLEGTPRGDEAIATYRSLLSTYPGEGWLRLVLARALVPAGRASELLETLPRETVGALGPHPRAEAIALRAVGLEMLGRFPEALSEWEALELLGSGARETSRRGRLRTFSAMVRSGRFTEVLGPLESAVVASPADADANRQLGLARVGAGRIEEGLASLAAAHRLAPVAAAKGLPPESAARLDAAAIRLRLGDAAGGADLLAPLVAISPGDRAPRLSSLLWEVADRIPGPDRAVLAEARPRLAAGDFSGAVRVLSLPVDEIDRATSWRLEAWGAGLVGSGRFDEADRILRKAEEIEPGSPVVRLARGFLADRQENFPEAERHFRAAVELDPEFRPPQLELGRLLSRQGKHREAISVLRKAVALDVEDPGSHAALAIALGAAGMGEEARFEMAESRRLQAARRGR